MKNYLIIGGSSGIGGQLVSQLVGEGHRVYATFNNNEIQSDLQDLSYHKLDVLESELDLEFLPEQVDGLAYCAGSINLKPFKRFKPEDFVSDYRLQVEGAVKVIQAIQTQLKKSGNASIVMFSTVAVQNGFNFHSQVSANKGAIEGLTRALAAEFAPAIRVNCIAPSLTDTPLAASLLNSAQKKEANAQRHPLKKVGQPSDIANMAEYLLSDKAQWITGQIFHVDGGISDLKI